KKSTTLKELKGTLTAQVLTPPEALVTVDNVMKAAGKSFKIADGGSVKVIEVGRDKDDLVTLKIQMEMPPGVPNVGGGIGGGQMLPAPAVPPAPLPPPQNPGQLQVQPAVKP